MRKSSFRPSGEWEEWHCVRLFFCVDTTCVSHCDCCCDQISDTSHFGKEGFILDHSLRDTVHHDGEGMVAVG